jgi:hypothetical protein
LPVTPDQPVWMRLPAERVLMFDALDGRRLD